VRAALVRGPALTFALSGLRSYLVLVRELPHAAWWPLAIYKIGKAKAVDAVFEPQVGGRRYELGDDGSTCNWGRVLVWHPHSRLVLSWDINADWQPDPARNTEIEVRFIPNGENSTRVEFEHRRLDRYGARRDRCGASSILKVIGDAC